MTALTERTTETIGDRIAGDRRGVISSLWVFVLFNMLFRDIHEIFRPGALEEYGEMVVPETLFLAAGVAITLSISMIPLTRILPARGARIMNLITPVLSLASMPGLGINDLDDAWFMAVEAVALVVILTLAWRWER